MSGVHVDLDAALSVVEGEPGWREDAEGRRFYSAAWLSDVGVVSRKLAPVVAIAGATEDERDALQARRSAQDVIAKQGATRPPDGNIGTTGALLRARPVDRDGRRFDEVDPLVEVDRVRVLVVQTLASALRHGHRLVELLGEHVDTVDAGIVRGRLRVVESAKDLIEEDTWRR